MAQLKNMKYIDLFAGAGGLSLGLYNAGLKGIFAIEKNPDAFATLKYNLIENKHHFSWPQWLPVQNHDIIEFVKKYSSELSQLKSQIDLIVGGPPCQGFSMAGKRDHTDIRNTMVHYYLEIIEIVRPKFVVLENVHGFTLEFKEDNNKIPYSKMVVDKLQHLGYTVETAEINMSKFYIPQNRVRFILVGSLEGNVDNFFERLHSNKTTFQKRFNFSEKITVEEAIGDLLESNGVYKCPDCKQNFKSGVYGQISSAYQALMRQKIEEGIAPNSHRFAKHTPPIVKMQQQIIDTIEPGKRITPKDNLIDGLKRRGVTLLDRNGQSPTITSHPDDLVHYCEPRILTVRELARLQSFPDWYEFKGKYTTGGHLRKIDVPRYTQVGNAVPPLFAEQLGLTLLEIFNEIQG